MLTLSRDDQPGNTTEDEDIDKPRPHIGQRPYPLEPLGSSTGQQEKVVCRCSQRPPLPLREEHGQGRWHVGVGFRLQRLPSLHIGPGSENIDHVVPILAVASSEVLEDRVAGRGMVAKFFAQDFIRTRFFADLQHLTAPWKARDLLRDGGLVQAG